MTQIHGLRSCELHIGARGVEVRVVGNNVAFLAGHPKQDALGGASLVRRNHVFVAENILNGTSEAVEAAAAGIAFIALHDGGPLVGRHGAGARIGQQVDEHVVGLKQKKVVVRGLKKFFALRTCGPANRLDTLDPERLDDGSGNHIGLSRILYRV